MCNEIERETGAGAVVPAAVKDDNEYMAPLHLAGRLIMENGGETYRVEETITRMGYTHRRLYTMLASQLLREGKKEKALAVLDKCEEEFPASILPHNFWQSQSYLMGQTYLALGETEKGMNILSQIADNEIEYLTWYLSLGERKFNASIGEIDSCLRALARTLQIMDRSSDKGALAHYTSLFNKLYEEFQLRLKL